MTPTLDWFPVARIGDDLLVPRAAATWFGGDSDPEDNGQTASGVPTKGNPTLLGCALPLAGYGLKSLRGTPLPMMAFGLHHDGSPNRLHDQQQRRHAHGQRPLLQTHHRRERRRAARG